MLPALDALGNGHFAFARQQWHRSHLAQVQADRIFPLAHGAGRQVQIRIIRWGFGRFGFGDGFAFFQRCASGLGGGGVFVHGDAVALKGRQHLFDFVGRMHLGRKQLVHLVIEQVSPLLAQGDQVPYLIKAFFDCECQCVSPLLQDEDAYL